MLSRFLIALSLCLAAQAQKTGSVQGTVTSTADRQPVRKAVVTITSQSPDRSFAVAITDAAGHFTLPGIPQGRYRLQASHSGFVTVAYGALSPQRPGVSLNLAAGETRPNVTLLLAPANTISGTVMDPEGDGIRGVQVLFYRKRLDRGTARYENTSNAATDSHGHYETSDLQPGEYWVTTRAHFIQALRTRPVLVMGEKLPNETLASQIFPGVDRVDSATPVVLVAGRDVTGIDFHLNYVDQVALHGTVSGIQEDARNTTLSLEPVFMPGDHYSTARITVDPAKPSFRIPAVSAGNYRLTVQSGARRSITTLHLTSPDNEVNVVLTPGVAIAGSVTFEGPIANVPKRLRVSLSPGDGTAPTNLQTRVEEGSFEFDEVPTGVWDIDVNPMPRGSYIKFMRLGTKDVLLEDMVIGPASKGPLAIVISTAAPKVEGTVTPAGPATILAAPTGNLAAVSSFYQSVQADEKGHFSMTGLNPGTYKFYAFDDVDPNAWREPKFLLPFEAQAKDAELKESATETLALTIVGKSQP